MEYKGLIVSGKMFAGKNEFIKVFMDLVPEVRCINIGFSDKLKLFSKYLLVLISKAGPDFAAGKTAKIIHDQLFGQDVPYEVVAEKIRHLVYRPYIKNHAKPGIKMPDLDGNKSEDFPKKEFGFGDIDALLWADCGKPREMLQELGTECVRSIHDSAWIDYTFAMTEKHPEYLFCISDGRFPNEMEAARRRNFLDVRIEASESLRIKRGLARDGKDYSSAMSHSSEVSLDRFHFSVVLYNEGTVKELQEQVMASPVLLGFLEDLRSVKKAESTQS